MVWAVDVQNVCKNYLVGDVLLPVLRGLSFKVTKGELVAITGDSGSGKSTLLHLLGALDSPTSGTILIDGANPNAAGDAQVSGFRNLHVGFVFQQNNLLPEFTALENAMMPGLIAGKPKQQVKTTARDLLCRVGLEHRLEHYPGQMSGGEQQRLALGRALVNNPTLLLADEPSGNLDSRNAENVHALFGQINKNYGTTVIVVTHNVEFAKSMERRIEIRDGLILNDSGGLAN